MANYTYTVTVASGNLYGGGTGNVFYLDGVRNSTGPGTVSWVESGTLRFEQSDASNNNHPLIFSTTTSKDQYLTSGVTYYLDGAVTYSQYTNTTTFNAATTRYIEVTPSSQTDFYYLCFVHGIGMGGIFDITSNTWGALQWSQGAWGNQADIDVDVTGVSMSSSIGSLTSVAGGVNTEPSGIVLNSSQGTTVGGTSALVQVTGSLESMAAGSVIIGVGADVQGSTMTSSIGSATVDETTLTGEGWGRGEWGEFAWGDNYSVQVTGIELTSSIGEETAFTDITVNVSGQQLGLTQGLFSLIGDFGIVVFAAEDQLDFTIGTLTFDADANVTVSSAGQLSSSIGTTIAGLKTPVDVTGIQATMALGSIALEQTTIEPVSGQQATLSLGQHAEIPGQLIGVSGLQMASSIGSVSAVGTAGIDVTGIQLTASIGNANITSWQEIDPGVNNVWSTVDLAA